MLKNYFFLVPTCLLTISIPLQGLQIGSGTSLTVEGTVFFTGTGNSIESLAFIDGGMSLQDATTTASFNTIFSIEGDIDLNGGALYLQRDMHLTTLARLGTGGTIYGNNQNMVLPDLNETLLFPTGIPSFGAPLDLVATFTGLTPLIWDMSWSGDGQYLAITRAVTSQSSFLEIYYFNGITLELMVQQQRDPSSVHYAVGWHPTEYVIASLYRDSNGSTIFCDMYRFFPLNPVNQRLATITTITLGNSYATGFDWAPDGTKIGFMRVASPPGSLWADVYSFEANDTFVLKPSIPYTQFLPYHGPTMHVRGRGSYAAWDPSSTYFISTFTDIDSMGPSADPSGPRLILFYDNDSVVTTTLIVPYQPIEGLILSMDWMHTGSSIVVGSHLGITVYTHDVSKGTLTLVSSLMKYNPVCSVNFNPHDTIVLAGIQNIDESVDGASGGTQELQLINYDSFSGDLSRAQIVTTNTVRSGFVFSGQPVVQCSPNNFMAIGTITGTDVKSGKLLIYKLHEMKDFTFDTITLSCGSDVVMTGSCTFNGNCVLDGGGHTLDFSSMGHLVVAHDSTLSLQNLIIKGFGLQPDQLVFQDTTSVLKLSNVVIEFDNNITTTIGSIYVDGPVSLVLKDYLWTIDGQATLTIDGMTVWKEKGSAPTSGTVIFGEPTSDYCTLLNKGALKEYADGGLVVDTSNALIGIENIIIDTSNAIVLLAENECNCQLIIDTSNAIATWSELTYDTSNAVESLSDEVAFITTAYTQLVHDNSNAIVLLAENACDCQLIIDNSNAIATWSELTHDTSDAIESVSDEIPLLTAAYNQLMHDNSNAIVLLAENGCDCQLSVDNSNAIVSLTGLTYDTSNAVDSLAYEIGLLTGIPNPLVIDTSNAIAVLAQNACDCSLIVDTSNALATLVDAIESNSQLVIDTSNAVGYLENALQSISGVDSQLIRDTSTAIVVVAENACDCQLIVDDSNAIVTWAALTKETSNAVIATSSVVTNQLVIDTSNALVSLVESLPNDNDIIITTTTQLAESMFMQPGQRMLVTGDVTLDGGGATIVFAAPSHPQFVIRTGSTLRLRNIELLNIHATTIDLQKGATLIIERNVVWELVEDITLSQGLMVVGDTPNTCVVRGNGNRKLTLKPALSYFAPSNIPVLLDLGSNVLTLENVELVGLEYSVQSSALENALHSVEIEINRS